MASSSSSSNAAPGVMSIQCGACGQIVQVQPPREGGDFTFPCPGCNTQNQASCSATPGSQATNSNLAVQCCRCRITTQVRPPPGGGVFSFSCPGCRAWNRVQAPSATAVICGHCSRQQQVMLPPTQEQTIFTCSYCRTQNSVQNRSLTSLMCTSCRQMVQVQAPANNSDFSFPCPLCGATNRVKDHPREFYVTVPKGCSPGDEFRTTTPDGLKYIAKVPAGATPGFRFKVEYRPRKHAMKIAQEYLPTHKMTAQDIRKAPEDCKDCPICLDAYKVDDAVTFLPCFHRFHHKCIKDSMNSSTRCPLCNKEFHEAISMGEALLSENGESTTTALNSVTLTV
mmetsp:Transcript_2323/g.4868  ORF Transcript_2323/g.4868 Transcript_2323/m.4868 type:complete len:339 (-) Transcript_2323:120-1136(-)